MRLRTLQFLLIPAISNFIMTMHSSLYSLLLLLVGSATTTVFAFAPPSSPCIVASHESASPSTVVLHSEMAATMADSGKPPSSATSDMNIADVEIPTKLPSDVGMDYVPLATMLATGQLAEADQVRQRLAVRVFIERGACMYVCVRALKQGAPFGVMSSVVYLVTHVLNLSHLSFYFDTTFTSNYLLLCSFLIPSYTHQNVNATNTLDINFIYSTLLLEQLIRLTMTTLQNQFTRDALIVLAGSKAKGRDFVYFTEVKRIPSTDLATIERLWNKFSGGKFGYTVQKVSFVWAVYFFHLFD